MSIKNLMADTIPFRKAPLDKIVINSIEDILPLAKRGVYYASQDNYVAVSYDKVYQPLKLYADSATSCVAVIVTGKDSTGKNLIAMAHLSCPGRFQQFFSLVDSCFSGELRVYASGANPGEPIVTASGLDYTSFTNANVVIDWVKDRRIPVDGLPPPPAPGNFQINTASLSFGQGNPSVYANSLDCFGIQMQGGIVSRDREWLSVAERNPTGGVQTLFCKFGDPNTIRPLFTPFTPEETAGLVKTAKDKDFGAAADMTDEQILNKYSTTPGFEVPWFCDTIRIAARFVRDYAPSRK